MPEVERDLSACSDRQHQRRSALERGAAQMINPRAKAPNEEDSTLPLISIDVLSQLVREVTLGDRLGRENKVPFAWDVRISRPPSGRALQELLFLTYAR